MCPLASYGELDLQYKYLLHPYEKWVIFTRYTNVFGFYAHINLHNLEEASSRYLSVALIVMATRYLCMKSRQNFNQISSKLELHMKISDILNATCESVSMINGK
jgi:hypothetical protein